MNTRSSSSQKTGTLYLVPNTLGCHDTEDLLQTVLPADVMAIAARLEYWVVENAKTARALLKLVAQHQALQHPLQHLKMQELNVRTAAHALQNLIQPLLDGHDVGLMSEAGVPAVADPGATLVRLAHEYGIPVRPLVGPSSLLLALMASGLNGQRFAFHGYLPVDNGQRQQAVRVLEIQSAREHQTQIFIETPYHNVQLLQALAAVCRDDTLLCAASDLTQACERIDTRRASAWRMLDAQALEWLNRRPTVFLMLAEAGVTTAQTRDNKTASGVRMTHRR